MPAKQRMVLFPFMRRWSVANRIAFVGILVALVGILAANVPAWYKTFFAVTTDSTNGAIYRLRVTVVDPQGIPVEDARVWSSIGGEPKKVAGGWQFDIPAASKPKDGKLTIFASKKNAFLAGQKELQLGNDSNPAVTVTLGHDTSATVRGNVLNVSDEAIIGATVSILGYGQEAVKTGEGGSFVLAAHAADGQQVQLHVEMAGFKPVNQWHPAGGVPAVIYLDRR